MRVTRLVTSKFFDNVTTNYDSFRSASSMFVPFLFEPILWISARRKNGLAASPSTKTRFRRSLYSAKRSIRFLSRQSNIFLLCTTGNITDFFIFFSFASLSLSLSRVRLLLAFYLDFYHASVFFNPFLCFSSSRGRPQQVHRGTAPP